MSERIRELAIEAGFDYDEQVYHIHYLTELIVKECMACASWIGRVNTTAVEPVHTAEAINQRIKQHFGVEE